MKIIDAHIHFKPSPGFDRLAQEAGHINSAAHLQETFDKLDIRHAVIMGNTGLDETPLCPPHTSYCIGLDSSHFSQSALENDLSLLEDHLRRPECVGIKLYPGYNRHYITEPFYHPLYDLAAQYRKPVAIHTGATANAGAHLKYCHPLLVDEVAADFPNTTFVLCHYGNPWVTDAAAVLDKNKNVCADLSGILDGGRHDIDAYEKANSGYMEHLRTWIAYPCAFDRLMYGTDWPLVHMADYIDFVSRLIPHQHWEDVFYHNADRIYSLHLETR